MRPFEVPRHVRDMVESKKRLGETYRFATAVIRVNEHDYYYASYHRGSETTGNIFVRSDGELPKTGEVIEAIRVAMGASTINNNFYQTGIWLTRRYLGFMKRANRLLDRVLTRFTDAPHDVRKSIERFREVTEKVLEWHEKYTAISRQMDHKLKEIGEKQILVPEDYEQLKEMHFQLGKLLFLQNYIQMQTYYDREKVIKFLFKQLKWIWAARLLFFHFRLHPADVKPKDRETFELAKRRYIDNQELETERIELEECLAMTRNPK
jgi:hypothetical protein